MVRDTIQLEDAVSTISQEYLLEFTSEYGIPESLHHELPGPEEPIVEFSEGKVGVYTKFIEYEIFHMDLFNLISAPNPTKVKTGTRPFTAHEVPLLTATASHDGLSSEIPPVENPTVTEVVPEPDLEKEVAAMGPLVNKSRRKRGNDEADANAPPKVLRKGHVVSRPIKSTLGGKYLASIGLEAGSTFFVPASQETPADVRDPDPLSYAKPQLHPERDVAHLPKAATRFPRHILLLPRRCKPDLSESPESGKSASFSSAGGSPRGIFQLEWGVINNCRLDTPDACQDMVDHIVPPGFEQEVRLLKKATAKIAKRDQRIKAREEEIKRLDQEIKSLKTVETEVQGLRNQTRNLETLLARFHNDRARKPC
ncbi:hypothetical protein Tco_1308628 [Tanacetum coccineum]